MTTSWSQYMVFSCIKIIMLLRLYGVSIKVTHFYRISSHISCHLSCSIIIPPKLNLRHVTWLKCITRIVNVFHIPSLQAWHIYLELLLRQSFDKRQFESSKVFHHNPSSTNPTKWSSKLKQFVGNSRRIVSVCLTILWGWYLQE